jgi:hypothetical protein
MATVRNYREHEITLNLMKDNQQLQFTFPAMKKGDNPDKPGEIVDIPGVLEVPDDVISAARKQYPAVEAYFAERWLRVVKKKEAAPSTNQQPPAPPAGTEDDKGTQTPAAPAAPANE